MPTETAVAFLVDPMGATPQALSEHEFEKISAYLAVARDEKEQPVSGLIDWLLYVATKSTPGQDDKAVLGRTIHNYIGYLDGGESSGILSDDFGQELEVLSSLEIGILKNTLAAVRTGGWFAGWLALQVGIRADASNSPDYRFATPLSVAASLGEAIAEFEASLEAARDFARMRPDLLSPGAAAKSEAKTRARNRSSKERKSRKKVSHAA